jgi:hypothetical protein
MSTVEQLLTPILGGVRTVNFFNGRILSGEDLSAEQEGQRRGRRLLGQASGDGIAFGLEVAEARGASTLQNPVLSVEAGLAVNRRGQTLVLEERTQVALKRQATTSAPSAPLADGIFKDCQPLQPGAYVVGESVYLLTLAPAEGREGLAPASGFGGIPATCGTRYTVEGVQFRLVELKTSTTLDDPLSLRNRIAYECFGVEETQRFQRHPFGPAPRGYGLLDAHRPVPLTDCEVPLALVYWTISGGIEFVDMWAVRRRMTHRAQDQRWEALVGDRRASEAEAMLFQFQQQLGDLFDAPRPQGAHGPEQDEATSYFRYLPPAGVLPLAEFNFHGFKPSKFFHDRVLGNPEYVDAALVRSLFDEAIGHEPLDLEKPVPVRLYRTWLDAPTLEGKPIQPSVVFASPYITPLVAARYDVARWDKSTYSGGNAPAQAGPPK